MKQTIKLKESELKNMIKETINEVLNEVGDTPEGLRKLGRLVGRKFKQNGRDFNNPEVIDTARYAERKYNDQLEKWENDAETIAYGRMGKTPPIQRPTGWFDDFAKEGELTVYHP